MRLYGKATAVVINSDEVCGFVKFAIFCVIDHPGGICGWNIDILSESKWYVIDFVSKFNWIGRIWCSWLLTAYLTYNIEVSE